MSFEGKVAIVTGAANGLGLATSRMFAERGGKVVLADIDGDKAAACALEIGTNARSFKLDVWEETQWIEIVAFAKESFGGYDILVNNAGVPSFVSIEEATREEWQRVFQVNAGGYFLGCKHAILSMKEHGGSIINISSNSTELGMHSVPLYSSSKGAVNVMTKAIVSHCKHHKLPIRCNTVVSGGLRGKMARDAMLDATGIDIESGTPEALGMLSALGFAEPEQVAELVLFLASDAAMRIDGAEILADGGATTVFSG